MEPPPGNITSLLAEAGRGNDEARHALWQAVYEDLRQIAHRELRRRRPGQTLQTTALVNEAYLKLIDQTPAGWENRLHFFAIAAKAMRHILIDYARQRHRQKRGGGKTHVALDEAVVAAHERAETFLALDKALTHLATLNERWAQVVEFRFFGGMTEAEIARFFGISERTVRRDWRKAKAWLANALAEPRSSVPPP